MSILEKKGWGRYVSPLSDKHTPPFNWYSFKHRFGSELVSQVLSMYKIAKGSTVFDPFCGGGTTLIKSKMVGYNSVGIDISPFSVFLTNALTCQYDPMVLENTLAGLSHEIDASIEIPDVAILRKSFSGETLKYIYSLKNSINTLSNDQSQFFLLVLLSILNDLSKAKKAGGFLRITEHQKVSFRTVKKKFIEMSIKYIDNLSSIKYTDAFCTAMVGDARNYPTDIKKMEYDAILTSPPYPNRHDYSRIYELELLVGFIKNNQALKKLRYDTLRSHVEAKKKFNADEYERPLCLEEIIADLEERELNNPQIISMLIGYFEDMYLCLKEMSTVLKKGAHVGLVVSNVRFAGVMIPVDELLGQIGEQVGLNLETIHVLRYRGNSSQQMQRYKKEPSRESLITWEK
jgi:SAM-dependent methyltransferase